MIKLHTPLTKEQCQGLVAGDVVQITGILYAARDAAHKRLEEHFCKEGHLPIDLEDQIIYYVGPAPKKPGAVIGPCGPTTSGRMDRYTPLLLDHGLRGMIGKGVRSEAVIESIIKNEAIYFAATGGAAALIMQSIEKAEPILYEDLGAEAIVKLTVKDFPCVVAIDKNGHCIYHKGENHE